LRGKPAALDVSFELCCAVACCAVLQGTSRGGANIKEIVRRIDLWGLDMVFVVGGNGGNAAADAIQREVEKQGVRCVVAGVPKSIDNDILLVGGLFFILFFHPGVLLCACLFVGGREHGRDATQRHDTRCDRGV
jgi:hypothetical protein